MEKSFGWFHKFIWLFWMPTSFLVSAVKAYSVITSYSVKYSPFECGGAVLVLFLASFVIEIAFVAAPVLVFIGFFNNKKFSWYILEIESISNVVVSQILIIRDANSYQFAGMLGRMLGVALDILIIVYYWKRKSLFGFNQAQAKHHLQNNGTIERNETAYCDKCGNQVSASVKFCDNCGAQLLF